MMAKVTIIYWSGTGNTESMANLIAAGAREAGGEVSLKAVSDATVADVAGGDVVVLGCPSMGAEVREEGEFEPFMTSIEGQLGGKKIALFGSYGWGDGEWMRNWEERVKSVGADLLKEGLIVNETPEGETEESCKAFGKAIGGGA
jgi:flavodoxin short chain